MREWDNSWMSSMASFHSSKEKMSRVSPMLGSPEWNTPVLTKQLNIRLMEVDGMGDHFHPVPWGSFQGVSGQTRSSSSSECRPHSQWR